MSPQDISPRTFPYSTIVQKKANSVFEIETGLIKNANSVVEIEAGLMKQHLLSRSWIGETILC